MQLFGIHIHPIVLIFRFFVARDGPMPASGSCMSPASQERLNPTRFYERKKRQDRACYFSELNHYDGNLLRSTSFPFAFLRDHNQDSSVTMKVARRPCIPQQSTLTAWQHPPPASPNPKPTSLQTPTKPSPPPNVTQSTRPKRQHHPPPPPNQSTHQTHLEALLAPSFPAPPRKILHIPQRPHRPHPLQTLSSVSHPSPIKQARHSLIPVTSNHCIVAYTHTTQLHSTRPSSTPGLSLTPSVPYCKPQHNTQ